MCDHTSTTRFRKRYFSKALLHPKFALKLHFLKRMGVRFIISNFWRFWYDMDTQWSIGLLSTNLLYFHNLKMLRKGKKMCNNLYKEFLKEKTFVTTCTRILFLLCLGKVKSHDAVINFSIYFAYSVIRNWHMISNTFNISLNPNDIHSLRDNIILINFA